MDNCFGSDYGDLVEYTQDRIVKETPDGDIQVVNYLDQKHLLNENQCWMATAEALLYAVESFCNPDKTIQSMAATERVGDLVAGYDFPVLLSDEAGCVLINPKIHGGEIKLFTEQMLDTDEAISSDNESILIGFGPTW